MAGEPSRASLIDVVVFDPSLGGREGEEERAILYYYPPNTPIDVQTRNIGLAQAFINFTSTFSRVPCEVVHSVRHRQVFLNPEGTIWLTMTIRNPSSSGSNAEPVDGEELADAGAYNLEDNALKAVLRQVYDFFRLFQGSMSGIIAKYSVAVLMSKLARCLTPHVSSIDFGLLDPFHTQSGLHYLPIDRNTYLRVQCFVHAMENKYSQIRHTVFLFDDHLIFSSLDADTLRVLYKYILDNISTGGPNVAISKTPRLASASAPRRRGGASKLRDGFLTGPVKLSDPDTAINAPHVFLHNDEERFMLLYHLRGALIVFLLDTPSPVLTDCAFYAALEHTVLNHIDAVVADIGANVTAAAASISSAAAGPAGELDHTFVYHNEANHALKSSLPDDVMFPRDVCRVLWRVKNDLDAHRENVTEVVVRSDDEGWVTGRKSDSRSLFVVFEGRKATLTEINDAIQKLSQSTFGNIFID